MTVGRCERQRCSAFLIAGAGVSASIEEHFSNLSIATLGCFEERGGAVTKLRVDVGALVQGGGDSHGVTSQLTVSERADLVAFMHFAGQEVRPLLS